MTCLVQSQWVPATIVPLSTSTPCRIDSFEARNNDAVDRILTVYIVPNGNSPDDSMIRLTVTIGSKLNYLCPEIVGHDLDTGDTIQVLADAANMISIRASGRASNRRRKCLKMYPPLFPSKR